MNKKLQRIHRLGFTLIELMVVVAIIGVLMAAGVAALGSAQTGGRDARRLQEIDAVSKAFEKYALDSNVGYPVSVASAQSLITGKTYFAGSGIMPTDPKTGTTYIMSSSATNYCLCANVENISKANANVNTCASFTKPAVGSLQTTWFFCMANQQ